MSLLKVKKKKIIFKEGKDAQAVLKDLQSAAIFNSFLFDLIFG